MLEANLFNGKAEYDTTDLPSIGSFFVVMLLGYFLLMFMFNRIMTQLTRIEF